jgi:phage I-like protein
MKGPANKINVHCFSVRIPARMSGEPLPVRKLVLPWGTSQAIDGPVVLDESSVRSFSATQIAQGWDRVALDYEHNTVPGTPAYKESQEPREVSAFGIPTLVPGEGLYLDALEWTPGGIKSVANFCDISPALTFQPGTRTVQGLHSAALCRAGAIAGLRAFSVEIAAGNADVRARPSLPKPTQGTNPMERTVLLALLGLADSATDDQMMAAAKTLGTTLKGTSEIEAMSAELKDIKAKVVTFSATGDAHKSGIEEIAKRLEKAEGVIVTFSAERMAQERNDVIMGAAREGKVLPFSAEALKTVDLATLREVAKNTPATVPLEQRTHAVETFSADNRAAAGDPGVTAKVAAMFGRKPEDLVKAGV